MPHPLKSPCPPPAAVFGYFLALDPAKPGPAFLHSQLLKAGNKAGIAPSRAGWQGIFRGCSLSTFGQESGQGIKGPIGTTLAKCFPACSVVLMPAKVAQSCQSAPKSLSLTAHPVLLPRGTHFPATYSLTLLWRYL